MTLVCRELSFVERWIAERHLARCQSCLYRRRALEGPRAQRMIRLYGELANCRDEELQEKPRAEFSDWLRGAVRQAAWQSSRQPRPLVSRISAVIPAVSAGLVAGAAITAVAFVMAGANGPKITANSLLVHAEQWDVSGAAERPGVAHQTVRISTPRQSMDMSVYWDMQGKRKARPVALPAAEAQIERSLRPADINWERPISASSYQNWHDHQHIREDHITRTGRHLLTLTTSVPEGNILRESITVRDTDFHPVERTVGFRDRDTVEITELDYSVLPWNAVDANVFEPLPPAAPDVPQSSPPAPHLPLAAPAAPSVEQLDETELVTRMILNQLHADEDGQIEVRRSEQGIEVVGLVATEDRKRELVQQLMAVPRLKISIQSETDLKTLPPEHGDAVSVESEMLPDTPSALERYLRGRGRTTENINGVEQQLFEDALVISRESRFIIDLKNRFSDFKQMPILEEAEFESLLYSHHERLETALAQEQGLMAQVGASTASAGQGSAPGTLLLVEADKNLALIRELTQNSVAHPRSAEEILADMAVTLESLLPAAREIYAEVKDNRATGEKE